MSALTDPNFASSKSSEVSTVVGIFDVEGTLIDCVAQTLESWRETLVDFGLQFSIEELHPFSGMDSGEMLDALLAGSKAIDLKQEILEEQGERYRNKFLPQVAQHFVCHSNPWGAVRLRIKRPRLRRSGVPD